MIVIKDLLKTMLSINDDTNLKPSEKILLSSLILYHSYSDGYSYPNYEHLMITLSTKRKATVSDTLKGLEEKEYITIKKARGNKNLYYIHKYLFYVGENVSKTPKEKPVDSNGKNPLENQIHVDEVIEKEDYKVIEISKYTGFNKEQSIELLKDSENDTAKVIKAFEFTKRSKNVKDEFYYTKWAIKNPGKIELEYKPVKESNAVLKFNNFESRQYDYESLEKKLLGWDVDGSTNPSDYMINN